MEKDVTPDKKAGVSINPKELMDLYLNSKHTELSTKLLEVLNFLNMKENTYLLLPPRVDYFISVFVENFLYFFTKEDFVVPQRHWNAYILLNNLVSNLVAMSGFRNTDPHLKILLNQKNNLVKLLTLYSRRNEIVIDYDLLFKTNQKMTSLWYWIYFIGNTVTKTNYDNTINHIAQIDKVGDKLEGIPFHYVTEPYFRSTYADPENDRKVKSKINAIIKESFKNVPITNKPNKKKIAVISGRWFPGSAVYKTQYDYVKSLSEDYDLTLVTLTEMRKDTDTSLFKDVRHVGIRGNNLNITALADNDFGLAYYPDVGMHPESVYLANLRLSPIQVTQYGHPVSTFGSEIDYFIGGYETDLKGADNYSERLVLIPGLGQHPVYPDYTPHNKKHEGDDFIISCTWSGQKNNYPMLMNLKKIAEQANKRVTYRIFTGGDLDRWNFFLPSAQEIASVVGSDRVTVYPFKPYKDYMALLEESDMSLDSYPFGGCNTIVDILYARNPLVAYEGTKAYNRLATVILRKLGLDELVASNDEEYIAKTVKLVNDDKYNKAVRKRIHALNLKKQLFTSDDSEYFKKAIDYLIENHDELKKDSSKKPIIIKNTKKKK